MSAEWITPYPPGIPAIAPGELINEAVVGYLEEIVANGAFLEGAADPSLVASASSPSNAAVTAATT